MPTLLVVDDEPNVLYSLEKALGSEALRVRTARTAREGVEAVREQRPDAVILDVRLPDLPGLEAFEQMRGLDLALQVLVRRGQDAGLHRDRLVRPDRQHFLLFQRPQ